MNTLLLRSCVIAASAVAATSSGAVAQVALNLFNGTSTNGWNAHGTWVVAGGALTSNANGERNQTIFQASHKDPLYKGMATTIVAAYFDGNRMWIAHVGDSRAYLLRQQCLHRLTDDHSQLSKMLREGRTIPPEEMAHWDSVLTQAIGASDMVIPTVTLVQVLLGDCFVLATDGICKALTNAEMLSLLLDATSSDEACRYLVDAANEAGGHDNATCVVIQID